MTDDFRSELGLLTPTEVAAIARVSEHTLAVWRAQRKGPSFVKLGRAVFYRRDDVKRWVEESVCAPAPLSTVTEAAGAAA